MLQSYNALGQTLRRCKQFPAFLYKYIRCKKSTVLVLPHGACLFVIVICAAFQVASDDSDFEAEAEYNAPKESPSFRFPNTSGDGTNDVEDIVAEKMAVSNGVKLTMKTVKQWSKALKVGNWQHLNTSFGEIAYWS